ncbi:hypothetical protein ABPG72_013912 [Tetrahymena utriculariae]
MSGDQLPTLKRRAYKDQVFCWIESGETEKVIKFIDAYEHHTKQFVTMNSWSIPMFACRYGNLQLLEFLHKKKLIYEGNYQYTLVHAACFGNEIEVLKYLLDVLKKDPVPMNEQQPPLKICFRAENQQLAELLISRGAYFQYGSFCHNVRLETIVPQNPQQQPQHKYKTIQRDSKNEIVEIEVPASLVFQSTSIPKDSNMLSFLRFSRVRNFIYARRVYENQTVHFNDEKKKENFYTFAKISFESPHRRDKILEYLIGSKEVRENTGQQQQQLTNVSNQVPPATFYKPVQYQNPPNQNPQQMIPNQNYNQQAPLQGALHNYQNQGQQMQPQNPNYQPIQQHPQQNNQVPPQFNNTQNHPNPN